MKKRTLALTLVLCILLGMQATPVSAEILEQGTCGEGLTWTLDDSYVLTISGTGAMEDYEVYRDVPWYVYWRDITAIEVEDGVTSIGDYAFYRCESAETITIGKDVEHIGDSAFRWCQSAREIEFPSNLKTIGESAFMDADMRVITIPASVTSIGLLAFSGVGFAELTVDENNLYYCAQDNTLFDKDKTRLMVAGYYDEEGTYTIPDGVTQIDPEAFVHCSMKKVELPASVTQIGDRAFELCYFSEISVEKENTSYMVQDNVLFNKNQTALIRYPNQKSGTEYIIPHSVVSIEEGAFRNCRTLRDVHIPSGVINIGSYAFYACDTLERIDLPDGITTIQEGTFGSCDSLTGVTIPEGVITICDGAFDSSGLEWISLPKSLECIEDFAIDWCDALTDVYYCGSEDDWYDNWDLYRSENGALMDVVRSEGMHFNTYADVLWGENVFTRWTASVNTPTLSAGASTHSKSSTAQNAVVCIAAYKGDQLLDVQMKAGSAGAAFPLETSKTFAGIEQPDEIRIFSWNGLSALSPYCVSDSMDVIYE
ncbi:MAG: leucine-rich repeat domain-containing protein [Ruminococcaceae bacterium]|nr:leucine-rich repeat domain-containing protein [Oscillospiraceae bacterium]